MKFGKIRRFVSVFVFFAVSALMFLSGCSYFKKSDTKLAVEYISKKYPYDVFTLYSKDDREFIFGSKLIPDAKIRVYLLYGVNFGNRFFQDNYLYWKYKNETSAKLTKFANEVFGNDCYVEDATSEKRTHAYDDMPFDEYFSDWRAFIELRAVLPPSYILDKGEAERQINSHIGVDGFDNFNGEIVFLNDENLYDNLKNGKATYNECFESDANIAVLNFAVQRGKVVSLEWKD